MRSEHRTELAGIKRFDQLVRYLRDHMGWPIEGDDFEELTYEYTPEELGIDEKNAAKIQEIKRLRPLVPNQPWGIFFLKFEPKRLPVVVLRRILSQLALKKRASANKSERQAWAADDLLFVSNYGEGNERQISFAHFSTPTDGVDLPTLKVLGWDNLDTALHLDAVARELTEHLSWPTNEKDTDTWREKWRSAFTLRHREVITTSQVLSIRLAELARAIRDRIKSALDIETERGPLTKLMKAFQQSLVHDLDANGFADMYAQTISYGLLSARMADPLKKTVEDFSGHMRTNPFLRELMEAFIKVGGRRGNVINKDINFDELGVNEVVELLDNSNMEAVILDFGDRNRQEDPVIHFYELFLNSYNKKLKLQRGVFYTPQPVVSYIVRGVHELLQTEFDLVDGLADTTTWSEMINRNATLKLPALTGEPGEQRKISPDEPFVQILDPAAGTATFLVETIEVIHNTLVAKWKRQHLSEVQQLDLWNEYVPKHLLPRLYGFELMMAPYAIAHMKIGLKLAETGYRFDTEERARIYLTNALEPSLKQVPLVGLDALAHEATAVNEVKKLKRFTVVIGNPPYSISSSNLSKSHRAIVEPYKWINGVRIVEKGARQFEKNIQDDYIKFIRQAEVTISCAGVGVIGFVTNHSFLTNPTFRGLRYSLLQSFNRGDFVDLHGNTLYGEAKESHSNDENVFDIQQGVAISLLRSQPSPNERSFNRIDYWGTRKDKYHKLGRQSISLDNRTSLQPGPEFWAFRVEDKGLREEYQVLPRISELMPVNSTGVKTHRDHFALDFDQEILKMRIRAFRNKSISDNEIETEFNLADTDAWHLSKKRKLLASRKDWERFLTLALHRPFDLKYMYYHPDIVELPRLEVMQNLLPRDAGNIAICFPRNLREGWKNHAFVSRDVVHKDALSSLDTCYAAPLFISSATELSFAQAITPNLSKIVLTWAKGLNVELNEKGYLQVFDYFYAVIFAPSYGTRYSEFLKMDFPRIPLTSNPELFRNLARLGGELVAVHLMESPTLDKFTTQFVGARAPEVEKASWLKDTVWIDKEQTIGFKGVPEDVWNFHIGGYQVCEKWLKDRKGRKLLKADIEHYQKIVVALSETIRLMKEIDTVIEKHGGWPGAFKTTLESKVVPFPRIVQPDLKERYITCVPLVPLKVAAGAFGNPQHIDENGFEWAAVETRRRLRPGMFVAQVVGKSMEPNIPDGAYCLFASPVEGTRQGKIVLVQLRDATDPETGQRYTIKRYESTKANVGDSWRHEKITLKPTNPEFKPIILTDADAGELKVIAEVVEVLGN
jgi:SOS-response transcriptional repressor LexA